MKNNRSNKLGRFIGPATLALGLLVGSTVLAAPVLWQTETGDWNVSRNITVTGEAALSGTNSSGVIVEVDVGKYTDWRELARVVIRVLQPESAVSPTISAEISVASGTSTFTSSTANNRVSEATYMDASLISVYGALDALGAPISDYNQIKNSSGWANATLTSPSTISRNINITQSSTTLFDSDNHALTSAQLESIFEGPGFVTFQNSVTSTLAYARSSGSEVLTAFLNGINSGTVIIEYYVIPEPGTIGMMAIALGSAGAFAFLRRRKNV